MEKRILKNGLLMALAVGAAMNFTSCKPEPGGEPPVTGSSVLSGEITGNRTLSADTVYQLSGFVYVVDGATITIPAGKVVKFRAGINLKKQIQ